MRGNGAWPRSTRSCLALLRHAGRPVALGPHRLGADQDHVGQRPEVVEHLAVRLRAEALGAAVEGDGPVGAGHHVDGDVGAALGPAAGQVGVGGFHTGGVDRTGDQLPHRCPPPGVAFLSVRMAPPCPVPRRRPLHRPAAPHRYGRRDARPARLRSAGYWDGIAAAADGLPRAGGARRGPSTWR